MKNSSILQIIEWFYHMGNDRIWDKLNQKGTRVFETFIIVWILPEF